MVYSVELNSHKEGIIFFVYGVFFNFYICLLVYFKNKVPVSLLLINLHPLQCGMLHDHFQKSIDMLVYCPTKGVQHVGKDSIVHALYSTIYSLDSNMHHDIPLSFVSQHGSGKSSFSVLF